jgi:hypothetical protein
MAMSPTDRLAADAQPQLDEFRLNFGKDFKSRGKLYTRCPPDRLRPSGQKRRKNRVFSLVRRLPNLLARAVR